MSLLPGRAANVVWMSGSQIRDDDSSAFRGAETPETQRLGMVTRTQHLSIMHDVQRTVNIVRVSLSGLTWLPPCHLALATCMTHSCMQWIEIRDKPFVIKE